jgi:hypothetical protein
VSWEAIPYEDSLRADWDALVRGARARHFLFERGYMGYHADRFEDASLLLARKGRLVAALPASRHGGEVRSHGGLTFGGLLAGEELTAARAVEALACALGAWRAAGARSVAWKPVPHIYHLLPAEEELFALVAHGARLAGRDVSCALPRGGGAPYSEERRRAVRRGTSNGLVVGRSDAFEEFMAMERDVLVARHGVEPVHTPAEMRLLAERFPEQIKLYEAREAGELVAGVVVYETPAVAHAQYIGASEQGRALRAGDAVLHHLLTEAYPDKPWFDFGISNERDGRLNEGLARNKEGFGGRAVVHDRYVLELA